MSDNFDGIPAPEARVRAFIQAQAEEDERTGGNTDEIAWAVPEGGPLVGLSVSDIRDCLAELAAARDVHAVKTEALEELWHEIDDELTRRRVRG